MIHFRRYSHALVIAAVLSPAFISMAAAQQGMSQRQIMQILGPMMQDEDFDEKLTEFAEEHDMDPNKLRAMMARQQGMRGGKGMQQMQQQQMQQQMPGDD